MTALFATLFPAIFTRLFLSMKRPLLLEYQRGFNPSHCGEKVTWQSLSRGLSGSAW